jgi:hypothetical protein
VLESWPRVDGLGLQRQDSEHRLVNAPERFDRGDPLQRLKT